MRIRVTHGRNREEAIKSVDQSVEQLLAADLPSPLRLTLTRKNWTGSTMHFSMTASVGILRAPVTGTVEVTDTEVVIEAQLPRLLTALTSERAIQERVERRVRGLLT